MKIVYTKHAAKKFKDLKRLGLFVSRLLVKSIIEHPLHLDEMTGFPKKIANGVLDQTHVLRVVYRQEGDIIMVITFYQQRKAGTRHENSLR